MRPESTISNPCPPGTYTVRAEAKSFQTVERTGIELQVQQLLRLDFQMQVGQVTEVITVSGGAPLLTTENATVGAVIENRRTSVSATTSSSTTM